MTLNKAYDQYRENSIKNSKPEELTLMLYNGLIKQIMQAQTALMQKRIEKANNAILRAEDIILEFQCTLDLQYEMSHSLMLLYDYMYRRLIDANVKKDSEILDEILHFAKELRDTWIEVMKLAKEQTKTENTSEVSRAEKTIELVKPHKLPDVRHNGEQNRNTAADGQNENVAADEQNRNATADEHVGHAAAIDEVPVPAPAVNNLQPAPVRNTAYIAQYAKNARAAKSAKDKNVSIQERL